jgi:hypothetical protein
LSIGLIALLDDIAAIAKAAAASLDDVATQAAKAGVKAAGVVIDDTAVTPRLRARIRCRARTADCGQDRGGITSQQTSAPASRDFGP